MSVDDRADDPTRRRFPIRHLSADPLSANALRWADEAIATDFPEADVEALGLLSEALIQLRHAYISLAVAYSSTVGFALRAASDWRTIAEDIGPPSSTDDAVNRSEEAKAGADYERLRECATDIEMMLNLVDVESAEARAFREDEGRWPRLESLSWAVVSRSEVP